MDHFRDSRDLVVTGDGQLDTLGTLIHLLLILAFAVVLTEFIQGGRPI